MPGPDQLHPGTIIPYTAVNAYRLIVFDLFHGRERAEPIRGVKLPVALPYPPSSQTPTQVKTQGRQLGLPKTLFLWNPAAPPVAGCGKVAAILPEGAATGISLRYSASSSYKHYLGYPVPLACR